MWNLGMCLYLGHELLISPKHFSKSCFIIQKIQFTKIINFNVSAILENNAHFGGRWVLRWSRILSISGSCSLWRRKKLRYSPAFLVDCWIFVCPGEPLSSTLLVMVSKCFYGSRTENWKQNRSFLMRASSWVLSILQPKRENVILDGLSYRISDTSFISFPEALWNAEVERLSTINALFITFVNLFFCILQCIVCVHWELMIHKCDQIWHAVAVTEGSYWWS